MIQTNLHSAFFAMILKEHVSIELLYLFMSRIMSRTYNQVQFLNKEIITKCLVIKSFPRTFLKL